RAGVTAIPHQWHEAGLGVRLALADGRRDLRHHPDRLRPGTPAALRAGVELHGPGDRHHAGDRADRTSGRQVAVRTLGTLFASSVGHRTAASVTVALVRPIPRTIRRVLPADLQRARFVERLRASSLVRTARLTAAAAGIALRLASHHPAIEGIS